MKREANLETLSVDVPEAALEAYEAAFSSACCSVGFFPDAKTGYWRVEGVKPVGKREPELASALALAAALSRTEVPLMRTPIPAEGWLARSYARFPEQYVGKRFTVRGTHLRRQAVPGRISLTLDAGIAFGSGEHGSTRGCLCALERIAWRRPRRILDMGTGSGILAIAAAHLLRCRVLATDVEPSSVRVARRNAALNRAGRAVRVRLANGWQNHTVRRSAPYDLVFANILARPLCQMARHLANNLSPGGTAILSGFLQTQARSVIAAHLRCSLRCEASIAEGPWITLILRRVTRRQ